MSAISTNYRELRPDEIDRVAAECASAWQDPAIPQRQYELAVKPELEKFRRGESVAPFDALVRCLTKPPVWPYFPTLLDVGASGGYYSEVLKCRGWKFNYTGCDYSPAFQKLAGSLYPGIRFDVADATALPYPDNSFDIVLHGAVLMHLKDYGKAIEEAARVAKRYVVFHRTPVFSVQHTTCYEKEAYQVRCIEWHFNEYELQVLFQDNGLTLLNAETVFWSDAEGFGHHTYLLEKQQSNQPDWSQWERA